MVLRYYNQNYKDKKMQNNGIILCLEILCFILPKNCR